MTNDTPKSLVLYVVNSAAFFLSHRLALATAAQDAGYDVHVATPPGPGVDRILDNGFAFHEIPMSRRGAIPHREIRTILALYKLYKTIRPDLVHHVTIKPVIYGGIAVRFASVPITINAVTGTGHVFTDKGWKTSLLRYLLFPALKFSFGHPACHAIFQNMDDARHFMTTGIVNSTNFSLIRGSGVDMSEFSPHHRPESRPIVLLAARMLWSKGVGEFVEAARIVGKGNSDARFVLAGQTDPGNPAAISDHQLTKWADEGVVEWWGNRDDMPKVISRSSIVCLPTTYGEGVPKVLIEAAASARPIVATDVPGCRDIVKDGENGILVPPRDPPKLAQVIEDLLADPDRRNEMGKKGREIAMSQFALEIVIDQTLALYRKMLAS